MAKIDEILTLTEVAKELNVTPAAIRMKLKRKNIDKKYYRKTDDGLYLFYRKYIEDEKKIS
jgi:IS30 family transposase